MSYITGLSKSLIQIPVNFLNKNKENIKNGSSLVTFALGVITTRNMYHIFRGAEVSSEEEIFTTGWKKETTRKTVLFIGKMSIILSGVVSRPGVTIISALTGRVCSQAQLDRLFGPNTIFEVNPCHPRHVISLLAVILAIPSIGQSIVIPYLKEERRPERDLIGRAILWVSDKITSFIKDPILLTDKKIYSFIIFNTITSRPVLHLGNQLGRFILGKA